MNENHRRLCPSEGWAEHLHSEVLPALVALVDLGDEVLELGPGPGASTEWLRHQVDRLVAIELDGDAVTELTARFADTNVEVVNGDASSLTYPDASFDAVGSFTMLHHVPTLDRQHAILLEAYRVLRPGGALLGSDSLASDGLHQFHEGDTYNPIDPSILLSLLRAIGFTSITIKVADNLLFTAEKPCGSGENTDREGDGS